MGKKPFRSDLWCDCCLNFLVPAGICCLSNWSLLRFQIGILQSAHCKGDVLRIWWVLFSFWNTVNFVRLKSILSSKTRGILSIFYEKKTCLLNVCRIPLWSILFIERDPFSLDMLANTGVTILGLKFHYYHTGNYLFN